jgi:hypothetical protein
MACAYIPGLVMAAYEKSAEEQPPAGDIPRQLALMDISSGEVVTGVRRVISSGGGGRARNARLMTALIEWARNTVPLTFWTLGTADLEPDDIAHYAQTLGVWMRKSGSVEVPDLLRDLLQAKADKKGRTPQVPWVMVLEQGESGKRWHVHMICAGSVSWQTMRDTWSRISGHDKPHVEERSVYSAGLSGYLAKYLVKDLGIEAVGFRRFRSSGGLRRLVAAHLAKTSTPALWCAIREDGATRLDADDLATLERHGAPVDVSEL